MSKEAYICQRRGDTQLSHTPHMSKETYIRQKRPTNETSSCQKRPVLVRAEETRTRHICQKETYIRQKRPVLVRAEETRTRYICQKETYIRQKRPIHIQKRPIHIQRDLQKRRINTWRDQQKRQASDNHPHTHIPACTHTHQPTHTSLCVRHAPAHPPHLSHDTNISEMTTMGWLRLVGSLKW